MHASLDAGRASSMRRHAIIFDLRRWLADDRAERWPGQCMHPDHPVRGGPSRSALQLIREGASGSGGEPRSDPRCPVVALHNHDGIEYYSECHVRVS
jgi:hypothetical protein